MFAYTEEIFEIRKHELQRAMNFMEYTDWISSSRVRAIVGKRAPISAHENTKEFGFFLARALRNVYDLKLSRDHDLPRDEFLPWEKGYLQ